MKLPKELTTVTPLSKYLALFLLIALPFIGFYVGFKYQEQINVSKGTEEKTTLLAAPTPTPLAIPTVDPSITANWKTYNQNKYSVRLPEKFTLVSKTYAGIGGQVQQDDWSDGEAKISILSYQEGVDPIVSILGHTKPEQKISVADHIVSKLMPTSTQPLIHVGPIKNGNANF